MSRHTLNDGVTPDRRITSDLFDEWRTEFAPPLKLIGDYYLRNLPWKEFEERYVNYLRSIYNKVKLFGREALEKDITLLCIEETPERCHRKLLAEARKQIYPDLEVLLK